MWSSKNNKCKHVQLHMDEHLNSDGSKMIPMNGRHDNEQDTCTTTYMHDLSDLDKRHKSTGRKYKILSVYAVLVTVALLFCITLLILYKYGYCSLADSGSKEPSAARHCLTPTCISLSDGMMKKMNVNVNPCDDFYEYACGRWIAETQIPEGFYIWNSLSQAHIEKMTLLKKEMERPSYKWGRAEKTVALIFNSCMNEEALARDGSEPLRKFISKKLDGWGMSSEKPVINDKWSVEKLLLKMYDMNFNPILLVSVVTDDKNTSRNVIALDQALLSLRHKDSYIDSKSGDFIPINKQTSLSLLQHMMIYVALLMNESYEVALNKSTKLIQFEMELAKTMPWSDERNKLSTIYHLTNLSDLTANFPQIDWNKILTKLFRIDVLPQSEPILVYGIDWLKDLVELITRYTKTHEGKEILDDYVKWFAIMQMLSFVDRNVFNSTYLPAFNFLVGVYGEPPRWIECLMKTEYLLPLAASKMLTRIKHDSTIKAEVSLMVDYIVHELLHELEHITWMDEKTKETALKKVSKLINLVGYSNDFLDPNYLEDAYKSFNLNEKSYFNVALAARSLISKEIAKTLRQNVSRTKWTQSSAPVHVNAFYAFTLNRIVIPLAILSDPAYITDPLMPFNFGSIGGIIGHEMMHTFDELGRLYDENGNLNDWWQPEAFQKFGSKSQCLVSQYSNYTWENIPLKGNKTLSENIADNGGLLISYKAFRTWAMKNLVHTLPGLNVTDEQLFFLGFAQTWCTKAVPELRRVQLEIDNHAIENFRVIGSLSNLDEFATAYNCPRGSPMNPIKKCPVW